MEPLIFDASKDVNSSLDIVGKVADSLTTPSALSPINLAVTNAISCASVVLLSGLFESFLKDLVREFIEKLNSLNKPASLIPLDMKIRHFSDGGKALAAAAKLDKDQSSTSNSEDLARRLASLCNPTSYELAWEAFSDTKSNPGPDVVKSILFGLGAESSWAEINSLANGYGQLDVFLRSFIKMRNVCAHTGQHATPPTGQMLSEYVDLFRKLIECIDLLVAMRLEHFENATT